MAISVMMTQEPDGSIAYSLGPLRIRLYDEYLIWHKSVLGVQESTIDYKDIISISYSNGGMFAKAYFQINTAEQIYKCVFNCAASGLEALDRDIKGRQSAPEVEKKYEIKNDIPVITYTVHIDPGNIEPSLTRIEMLLEDNEWERAKAYVEAALDYFPTDHRLYLLMLCIDNKVSSVASLGKIADRIQNNKNYIRMKKFASEEELEIIEKSMFPGQFEK